jgi:hypothetical protein
VYYLGGEPRSDIDEEGLRGARRLEEMLAINIAEEHGSEERSLLESISNHIGSRSVPREGLQLRFAGVER